MTSTSDDSSSEDTEDDKIQPLQEVLSTEEEIEMEPTDESSLDESGVFPIKDLPSTVQRMIIRMLSKQSRDNFRLVSRWFSETVVKLDASYRNIRILLDNANLAQQTLSNIKVKESFMQNRLKIHIVILNEQIVDETVVATASQILNDWNDHVCKLSITLEENSELLSVTNVFFKNLEYLQIKNLFIPRESFLLTEDLINRHKETIKILQIFKMPGLELDCRKFSVLTRLSVEGLDMLSTGAILRLCCESLVHLDIDVCSAPPVSQETIIDCQFSRLKYLSLIGAMNDLYANILNLSASQLLGLKILSRYFNGDLKEVDLPVLKFLYVNDYKVLPKSCPRLEFLKVGFYNADVDRFDSPKLTNLKAMIVPYNDAWATKVIKACKESLEFVHITSEISGAIDVDEKIMILPPNSHADDNKQWLMKYIKRNPLYNRMLKRMRTSDIESEYEDFHSFISLYDSDHFSFDPDDYDYDSEYDDIWDDDHDIDDFDQDFDSDDYDYEEGDIHGDVDDYDAYGDIGFEYFDPEDYDLEAAVEADNIEAAVEADNIEADEILHEVEADYIEAGEILQEVEGDYIEAADEILHEVEADGMLHDMLDNIHVQDDDQDIEDFDGNEMLDNDNNDDIDQDSVIDDEQSDYDEQSDDDEQSNDDDHDEYSDQDIVDNDDNIVLDIVDDDEQSDPDENNDNIDHNDHDDNIVLDIVVDDEHGAHNDHDDAIDHDDIDPDYIDHGGIDHDDIGHDDIDHDIMDEYEYENDDMLQDFDDYDHYDDYI